MVLKLPTVTAYCRLRITPPSRRDPEVGGTETNPYFRQEAEVGFFIPSDFSKRASKSPGMKKPRQLCCQGLFRRGGRIRTCGLLLPKQAR